MGKKAELLNVSSKVRWLFGRVSFAVAPCLDQQ